MSYVSSRIQHRRRAARAPRPALGGVVDVLFNIVTPSTAVQDIIKASNQSTALDCIQQANASVADLDAKWYNIAQNWNPVGNYSPADMNAAAQQVIVTLTQAKVAVLLSPGSTSDAGMLIQQALTDIDPKLAQGAQYLQAVTSAKAAGTKVINSPGFKDWVTSSLVAASNGFVTRSVLDCNTTWLDAAANFFDQVWNVVARIVDIAIKAGDDILHISDDVVSAYTYVKYAAIGLAAWWAYKTFVKA